MSKKKFINNLSSVLANIRKLDAKKIVLDNKDIIDHIKENAPTIKHSQDTRETVYENDLWGLWVETKDDGTIIIHDDWVTNPNASSNSAWLSNVNEVLNNKAYIPTASGLPRSFYNIQAERIKDGSLMFRGCTSLTSFSGDLSSLTKGYYMFFGCTSLTSFNSDLSSITNGTYMFANCTSLTSFSSNLSSLTNGNNMFYNTSLTSFNSDLSSLTSGSNMFSSSSLKSFNSDLNSLTYGGYMFLNCTSLTSFDNNLSSLTNGTEMFKDCTKFTSFSGDLSNLTYGSLMFLNCTSLTSFSGDLSSLTNGTEMFRLCTSLRSFSMDLSNLVNGYKMFYYIPITSFSGDLSNLVNGMDMFAYSNLLASFSSNLSNLVNGFNMFLNTSLTPQSVMYIVESIRNITEEKAKYTNGKIPWVTYDSTTQEYSAPFGFKEDGSYVYTFNNPSPYTTSLSSSWVGQLTLGIDVTNDSNTIAQLLQTFAEGCLYESWDKLVQAFVDKGWTVTFTYKGTNSPITLPEESA